MVPRPSMWSDPARRRRAPSLANRSLVFSLAPDPYAHSNRVSSTEDDERCEAGRVRNSHTEVARLCREVDLNDVLRLVDSLRARDERVSCPTRAMGGAWSVSVGATLARGGKALWVGRVEGVSVD